MVEAMTHLALPALDFAIVISEPWNADSRMTCQHHKIYNTIQPLIRFPSFSQDHLQSARHLFWKLVNGLGDSATKTNGQSNSDEIPHDQRSTGKERVHVQGSRAAVKLFMVFNMTLDEAGGLDRMRNEFVAPLLRLSRQQNGQVGGSFVSLDLTSI